MRKPAKDVLLRLRPDASINALYAPLRLLLLQLAKVS